jgi:protein TonB
VALGVVPPVALPGDGGPLVDAREFTGGLASGPAGRAAPGGAPFEAAMVDEPVAPDPRNPPPRYPEALRAAGVGGRAVARFVVDTLGRVEPGTVRVASPDDPRFADAAREALGRMRFRPARAGGVRVRQLVELPFAFAPGGPPR